MSKKKTKTKWTTYPHRIQLAGVQYSDWQKVCGSAELGDQVRFIGEPNNQWDNKAIRVEYDGVKIGYLPRLSPVKDELWRLHDSGAVVVGVITFCSIDAVVISIMHTAPTPVTKERGEVLFSHMRSELSYQ